MDKSLLFQLDLKLAPVYKKKSKSSKDNYKPVRILSNISKAYEKCIYYQIDSYSDKIVSNNVDFIKIIMRKTV